VVEETHALCVAERLSWAEAGGFPEVFSTAYDALFTQAALSIGDRVLVSGAAGGVGTAGVQLAAAAGAWWSHRCAIRDAATGWRPSAPMRSSTPAAVADHGPYDVVLELVGAASFPDAFGALATGGRMTVIGVGTGAKVELNLLQLMGARATMSGSTLRARRREEKAAVAQSVAAHVLPLLTAGRVRRTAGRDIRHGRRRCRVRPLCPRGKTRQGRTHSLRPRPGRSLSRGCQTEPEESAAAASVV